MEIQQLRHVLAASCALSYSQAAKQCFTSRQNIAHSIKVIESELNVTLFERTGNKMVLTPAGKKVVASAGEIIAKVDDLRALFVTPDMDVVPLDFAVTHNIFAGIPTSVTAFLTDYAGGIRIVESSCEECYNQVCSKKVDAALVSCFERDFPDCSVLEIATSPVYVLVSTLSPLAEREQLVISDLRDQKLMVMSEPVFQYAPLFSELDALGFDRNEVNVVTSTGSMLHMLRRSQTASIVSEKFAVDSPKGTVGIPLVGSKMQWHFSLLYRTDASNSRTIMRFVRDIQAVFAQAKQVSSEA